MIRPLDLDMMPYSQRGSIKGNGFNSNSNGSLNNSFENLQNPENLQSPDNSVNYMDLKNSRHQSISRQSIFNNFSPRKDSVAVGVGVHSPIPNKKSILMNSESQSQRSSLQLSLALPKISEKDQGKDQGNFKNFKSNFNSRGSTMKSSAENSENRGNSCTQSSNNIFSSKKNSTRSNSVLDLTKNQIHNSPDVRKSSEFSQISQFTKFAQIPEPPRKRVTGISFDKMTKRKDFHQAANGPSGGDYKPNFDSVRKSLKSKKYSEILF